jgi:hypothetical protein
MRTRGLIFIVLGSLLLVSTVSTAAAMIAILITLLVFCFVQIGIMDFLIAKIREDIRKIDKILQKMPSKNKKPD